MLRSMAVVALVLSVGVDQPAQAVPAGAQLDLLLTREIDAGAVKIDEKFEATLVAPVLMGGVTLLPEGALVSGYVGSVRPAGREQESRLTLAFSTIRVNDKDARIRGTVAAVLDPRRGDDPRNSVGPVTGVPSGPKSVVNVVVNAGGSIVARDGKNVRLPIGVILRVRLDEPIAVTVK